MKYTAFAITAFAVVGAVLATALPVHTASAQSTMTVTADTEQNTQIANEFRDLYNRASGRTGSDMPESVHITPADRVQLTGAEVKDIKDGGVMTVEVHGMTFDVKYTGAAMMSSATTDASRISVNDHVIVNGSYDDDVITATVITTPADRDRRIERIREELEKLRQQVEKRTQQQASGMSMDDVSLHR